VTGRSTAASVGDLIRDHTVKVPAHFDAEALAGVRRLVLQRIVPVEVAAVALHRIVMLDAERVAISPLLEAAFAARDRFSPHDSLYAVLARRESATLVTVDERLARACQGFVAVSLARG
jgi:predicted nucleic acid-binding protein